LGECARSPAAAPRSSRAGSASANAARDQQILVLCATHDPSVIAEADRVVEL
jgi:ABC-type lipoprotein export system ATPase subunit